MRFQTGSENIVLHAPNHADHLGILSLGALAQYHANMLADCFLIGPELTCRPLIQHSNRGLGITAALGRNERPAAQQWNSERLEVILAHDVEARVH